MKISRRKFIKLGAVTLAMLGLAKQESKPTETFMEIETGEPENDSFSSVVFPEQPYIDALEYEPMTTAQKQLAFVDEVLKTGGDVWPTPPENFGHCAINMELRPSTLPADVEQEFATVQWGRDVMTGFIDGMEIKESEFEDLSDSLWNGKITDIEVTAETLGDGSELTFRVWRLRKVFVCPTST